MTDKDKTSANISPTNKLHAFVVVAFIFNLAFLAKDRSSRTVVEAVFKERSSLVDGAGQIEKLIPPPTKPFQFVACNDTDRDDIFAAITNFDFLQNLWVTQGWIRILKGCQVIDSKARGPIYTYAMSLDGETVWAGGETSSKAPFCVDLGKPFNLNQRSCRLLKSIDSNVHFRMFEQVHTPLSLGFISRPVIWRIKSSDVFIGH